MLETRPFDYKSSAKVLAHHVAVRSANIGRGGDCDDADDGAIGGGVLGCSYRMGASSVVSVLLTLEVVVSVLMLMLLYAHSISKS